MENKQTKSTKYLPFFIIDDKGPLFSPLTISVQDNSVLQTLSDKTKAFILEFNSQYLKNRTAHLHNGQVLHIHTLSPRIADDTRIGSGDFRIMGQESSSMSVEILQGKPVDAMSYRSFYAAYERLMGSKEAQELDCPASLRSLYSCGVTANEPAQSDMSPNKPQPSKTLMSMMSRLDCPAVERPA